MERGEFANLRRQGSRFGPAPAEISGQGVLLAMLPDIQSGVASPTQDTAVRT